MPLIADRSGMLAPGACFLCELSPNEGEPVFDSLKDFIPGFPSNLSGRKYVCLSCASSVAEAFGFISNELAEANAIAAADADARLAAVIDQVASVVGDLSPVALQAAADGHPRFAEAVPVSAADEIAASHPLVPELEHVVPNVLPVDPNEVDEDEDVRED